MGEKVVGIIGGMGPEATVDLMGRVIRATPAKDDRDHIRMLVDNNPKVPSRIRALIEGTGESPAPCLREMARKLEGWGADFLAMPCNTAHYYYKEVREAVAIPVLDMIALSVDAALACKRDLKQVGLLASTAVLNLGLYEKAFAEKGVNLLAPPSGVQDPLMAAIRTIKTSVYGDEVRAALQAAGDSLVHKGAELLLVACTELSIISEGLEARVPMLDASQILAEAIVKKAGGA
ncbi:aspartate/glutamate racemase family protein [Desulfobotulus sp.]|jgi:aspartate racemase|uniref:aspartate/glutamate racemase family protein n=1 Tax=Desulfobotulus sp. TaxID=1940337 RepID=UPI002A36E2AD|nr:amino acid racemase [Desulfobotulus sp.]MDY0163562.1 amino acid racemase [Desulfobotulus sp.]